ncbi:MAG: hypothetical protein Q7S86_05005 [bacterium]|nr:hypothetical protein [bacterium]
MDEYYWTPADFEKLNKGHSMPEFLALAMEILERMPQPVVMVSGPISTGGHGSVEENSRAFADTIRLQRVSGKTVFNQLAFEDKFLELSQQSKMAYYTPILDDFFLPILKSGKIKQIVFMKDWQSSTGSRWEYTQAGQLGIDRVLN